MSSSSSLPSRLAPEARAWAAALRAMDPLAWAGLAAVVILAAFPVYWMWASVLPLFGGSEGHAADFLIYSRAGHRSLAEPLALYADPSFLYPPPSALLFALAVQVPLAWGYVLLAMVNVAALAGCVRLGERLLREPPRGWARAALWVAALASAPALQNVKYGQVNVFVLLLSLAFLLHLRQRPRLAGALLALGVWLKLYPVVLGVFALTKRSWPAILGGLAVAVLLPLALAWWLPLDLYSEYVTRVLPEIAGGTTTSTLNAGLPAIVERMALPPEVLLVYRSAEFGTAASIAGRLALVLGVAGSALAWVRGWSPEAAGVAILAVLPVASSFGWEYTFVLAMPLALVSLLAARRGPLAMRLLSLLAMGALFVQKPPEAVVRWAVVAIPDPVLDLFAARFVLALVALAGCALWARASHHRLDAERT